MKTKKKRQEFIFNGTLVVFVVVFLVSAIIFKIYEIEILPSQFYGALIGVFITAIVTAFLLRGQTEGDEKREKSIKVFEKKQEIYHSFLEKFQKIIQDGDIRIGAKKEDGSIDTTTDELKDLIFQLAFIQMHTSTENTKKVLSSIADVKQTLNDFNSIKDEDKNKNLANFYSELSENLFKIVAILKADLYPGTDVDAIPKNEMVSILTKFDLYVEVKDFDKYKMQTYFWIKLCELLKGKGYELENVDFRQKVNEFYARTKDFKWCGTSLKVEEDLWLTINTERNEFFYGFQKEKQHESDIELEQRIKKTSTLFKSNSWWYGYKYPDKYKLDFWSLTSSAFDELKNPRKRDNFIKELADEIDGYVIKFKETAK